MDPKIKAELRHLDRTGRQRKLTTEEKARRFEILREDVERDRAIRLRTLSPLADLATKTLSGWTERAAALEGNNILDSPADLGEYPLNGSPNGPILAPWEAEPRRLWSLLEMKTLFADKIVAAVRMLDHLGTLPEDAAQEGLPVPEPEKAVWLEMLDLIRSDFEAVGLECSIDQIDRIKLRLLDPDLTFLSARDSLAELINRYHDELARTLCFFLPRERARFWQDAQPFGPLFSEHFPSAIMEVEDAARCLACERGTAVVFHLMRTMEVGLKVTARALGIPYAPSWESYLTQIHNLILVPYKSKKRTWRKSEPFFKDALILLQHVKVAWRNPTMHIVKRYSPEEAEDVFNAVRAFMKHLATKLKE